MFELTWEISILLHSCEEQISKLNITEYNYEKHKQAEAISELYAKTIELTCRDSCGGLIIPIDMAISWVSRGSINDYDGTGEILDNDGNNIKRMSCNVNFLKTCKKDGACFVAWYNK